MRAKWMWTAVAALTAFAAQTVEAQTVKFGSRPPPPHWHGNIDPAKEAELRQFLRKMREEDPELAAALSGEHGFDVKRAVKEIYERAISAGGEPFKPWYLDKTTPCSKLAQGNLKDAMMICMKERIREKGTQGARP